MDIHGRLVRWKRLIYEFGILGHAHFDHMQGFFLNRRAVTLPANNVLTQTQDPMDPNTSSRIPKQW